jgi:hypothetical protein
MITVLIDILSNWILLGLATAILFVLCYYFAVACEKIADRVSYTAKYIRARLISHK